jgi:hypothetical protein
MIGQILELIPATKSVPGKTAHDQNRGQHYRNGQAHGFSFNCTPVSTLRAGQ